MFFIFLPFDEMLAKVPYHFFHDPAGGILSCAQSRVFCASEKYGKEYCFNHTYRSENFWRVVSSVRLFNGTDAPQKMIIRYLGVLLGPSLRKVGKTWNT